MKLDTGTVGKAEPDPSQGQRPTSARGGRVGILLSNLGTPDDTETGSVRRYLREFLSDRRVIETPRLIWYPILYGIVLVTRPAKSAAKYKTIWNETLNESPLRIITRSQAERLAERFRDDPNIVVEWGMRYGNPSIENALEKLTAAGCDRIVFFPLYPQYSASTTATANDKLYEALMAMRKMPAVRSVPAYHDEPTYIEALARSIERHLASLDFEPEVLIASYHGLPVSYAERGDPYPRECLATTALLRERLKLDEKRLITTFQSRFGREEWLQPYTDKTVEKLARDGVRSIAIVNPGFSADCIETLEEIAAEVKDAFLHAGGQNFSHIPCLNDSDEGMDVIETITRRELGGWQ